MSVPIAQNSALHMDVRTNAPFVSKRKAAIIILFSVLQEMPNELQEKTCGQSQSIQIALFIVLKILGCKVVVVAEHLSTQFGILALLVSNDTNG